MGVIEEVVEIKNNIGSKVGESLVFELCFVFELWRFKGRSANFQKTNI